MLHAMKTEERREEVRGVDVLFETSQPQDQKGPKSHRHDSDINVTIDLH